MQRKITMALMFCLFAGLAAQAQPVRNGVDLIWARDVQGAELTLDGMLDEAVWEQAERIDLRWNEMSGLPGSGQKIEGNSVPAEPLDPNDGTLYVLRDGNTLWLGLQVRDKSIGGGRALLAGNWDFDGIIMSMTNRNALPEMYGDNFFMFGSTNAEFIYGWFHPADTTETGGPVPGIMPRAFGNFGVGFADSMNTLTEEDLAVWNHATTVEGTTNDDSDGDDVGYVMEMWIDLAALGYDMTQAGGDQVTFNIALQDADYRWPYVEEKGFTSRVWFQNQWANNFNEGVAYIYGAPEVTVSSGAAPEVTDAVFTVGQGAPTVDGMLDEEAWMEADPIFALQYQPPQDVLDMLPGNTAYMFSFFRPDLNGDDPNPPVLDPSLAKVKMLVDDNTLYIGVDVEDQAISGMGGESGMDGIRFAIRTLDSLTTRGTLSSRQIEFSIDSTGAVRYGAEAVAMREADPMSVEAAVALKGASTVADPTDVDEGYTMEIAIDLTKTFGYPEGLGDGRFWMSVNFFDGDSFEDAGSDYATRIFIGGERGDGASVYGFLSPSGGVANERESDLPERIALLGNYPNPFNPATTLRFDLPQAGDVTVQVFDVLGRQVTELQLGAQVAGRNEMRFDASSLASGVYLYRLEVTNQATGALQASDVGRMILVK